MKSAKDVAYDRWTLPHVRRLIETGKRENLRILFRRIFLLPLDGSDPFAETEG